MSARQRVACHGAEFPMAQQFIHFAVPSAVTAATRRSRFLSGASELQVPNEHPTGESASTQVARI